MHDSIVLQRSLEELEHNRWSAPAADSTGLVKAVHALRRRPIGSLNPEELRRLIGQDVGLPWLLPLAIEHLSDTAGNTFYDDDLLIAVLTRKSSTWTARPELALKLKDTLARLDDLSPYVEPEAEAFLASLPDDLESGN